MKVEETESLIKNWKHWLVYSTCTFLTIFVIVEFALSVSLFTMIAPSTFMFYFTPVGLVLGETIVSLFASVLLFVGLFIVLRFKVYVKTENGLKFNRSDAHLLLPFYLTAIVSLAIYISFIPLELSNLITYAIFILLFESLVEHSQVTRYGEHLKELFKKEPSLEYDKEKKVDAGQVEVIEEEEPVPPEEEIIPKEEEPVVKEPVVKEPVKELAPERPVVTKPVKVKKKVKKLKKLEEPEDIICPVCGYEEEKGANSCSECGEPFEEEEKDTFADLFEDIEHEFEEEPEGKIEEEFEETEEELEEEMIEEEPEEKIEEEFEELEEELKEETIEEEPEELFEEEEVVEEPEEEEMKDTLDLLEEEFEEIEEEPEEEEMKDTLDLLEEEIEEEETQEITEEDLEKELDEELRSLEEKTGLGEQIECPICGAKFDSTEKSCPECGEPIHEEEEEDFFSELY